MLQEIGYIVDSQLRVDRSGDTGAGPTEAANDAYADLTSARGLITVGDHPSTGILYRRQVPWSSPRVIVIEDLFAKQYFTGLGHVGVVVVRGTIRGVL